MRCELKEKKEGINNSNLVDYSFGPTNENKMTANDVLSYLGKWFNTIKEEFNKIKTDNYIFSYSVDQKGIYRITYTYGLTRLPNHLAFIDSKTGIIYKNSKKKKSYGNIYDETTWKLNISKLYKRIDISNKP